MADSISLEEFSETLVRRHGGLLRDQKAVAVGVSGGPDSMALVKLLSVWAAANGGPQIHALIVDHGLRTESAQEAAQVASWLSGWSGLTAQVLKSDAINSQSGVMENARRGRYDVMEGWCRGSGVEYLFLGHHQDDQAETLLFRLAKGSGLDGLAAMKDMQVRGSLTLLRPLLDEPKARLLATCDAHEVAYIQDPSNESRDFARVRLRQSMAVLEEEGLSSKRLATTAMRLARARQALEEFTEKAAKDVIIESNSERIVLNYKKWSGQPDEIALRIVLQGFELLRSGEDYAPRMEKIEALFYDLKHERSFRKRTLGGVIIERDDEARQVIIQIEKSA